MAPQEGGGSVKRYAVSVLIQHGKALTHALYLWPASSADAAEAEVTSALLSRGLELRGALVREL